jgi:trimethylamine--corrinoid protein Co-methyltransferase
MKTTDRMQTLSTHELTLIHDASLNILKQTGINFNDTSIAGIFRHHGFKTDGTIVFFREEEVKKALSSTVPEFKIHARNPVHTVGVGNDHFICLPTGGAPNIADIQGTQRPATLADFENCCRLVQTSDQLDMGGYIMVQPNDVPAGTSHLDMLLSYMTLCDKPVFGASSSGKAARDTIEMAGFLFGGTENLKAKPVMATVVNVMSPLQYSKEQADVIVEMARFRQPVVITNMILAGASGPVSLPSLLTLQNAEILAGIVLSQLVNPGTPMVYGVTSAPMDMKTMVSAVGAAETVKIAAAGIQLARFYNLPCRTGGGLTDAHVPDAQALAEGVLMLSTVIRNGAHFIYHSCGQMGSFISMSFEKWLIDEQVCRTVRSMLMPMTVTPETIDVDTIREIGIGGQYLTHLSTFRQFKTLSSPGIFNRKDYSRWHSGGRMRIDQVASQSLAQRLESYQKPVIDEEIEKALHRYVAEQKVLCR